MTDQEAQTLLLLVQSLSREIAALTDRVSQLEEQIASLPDGDETEEAGATHF